MKTLETVKARQKEAQKVKDSGILDNKAAKKTDDITDIDGFSFNVAWSFEGDNKRKAESKMDNLDSNSGYKIDYSNL